MRDLTIQLRDWQDAGIVTDDQARAISAFEAGQPEAQGPEGQGSEGQGAEAPRLERERRPVVAEAIGYVGGALALGAVFLLFAEVWQFLVVGGKLALVGLLTVLLAAAGFALHSTDRAPLQRLTSVLFTGALAGVAWLTVLVTNDLLRRDDLDVVLAVGFATTAGALPLYLWRRRGLPQLTLLAALGILVAALLARPSPAIGPLWAGLTFWALGVAWVLLALGRWLEPPRLAGAVGAVLALVAVQSTSFDDHRMTLLVVGLVSAGALVALAVATEATHHLAIGAVGLFVFVPQLAFEWFGDAIGAPATLLVVGLLMVLLAVGLGRASREVRPGRPLAIDGSGGEQR